MTSPAGWPKGLSAPAEITATRGLTVARKPGDVEEAELLGLLSHESEEQARALERQAAGLLGGEVRGRVERALGATEERVGADCVAAPEVLQAELEVRVVGDLDHLRLDEDLGCRDVEVGRRLEGEVHVDGKEIALTVTEFKILNLLIRRPGWVFSRYQIIDATKGGDSIITDRAVDVQIVNLRKKFGKAARRKEPLL